MVPFRQAFSLVFIALALAAQPVRAQARHARLGRFEVPGMDFSPTGGWRAKVNSIRSARHAFLRAGSIRSLNLSSPTAFGGIKVTGHVTVPVIPISFTNVAAPFAAPQLQDQLFSAAPVGRPYSLKTFYEQLSNGNITLDGQVFPWVTALNPDTYYEDGCNGVGIGHECVHGGVRFGELLIQALNTVSNGTDAATVWAAFDNDGPDGIPNSGDDNGVVDFVTFLQADKDGACSTPHIWAHRFVIAPFNGGSPYVTRTPWAGHPGQFISVNDYTMQSAVGGPAACDGSQIMPIGTVAHETGHAFGLPDLYDTSSGGYTEGVGEWGLMGSGNYASPSSPSRMEAWSLVELGWVGVDSLSTTGTVHIDPVTTSDRVLYAAVPNTDEYFLIENRQDLESDSTQMNPALGARRKMPGLLVWHVDQGQVDAHGFHADNAINAVLPHGVELVQADGLSNLDAVHTAPGSNRGDAGDSYPGSTGNRRISIGTVPELLDNQGKYAGFTIDSIYQVVPHGQMVFRFIRKGVSLFAASPAGPRIRINGVALPQYASALAAGDVLDLSADSAQVSADGAARYEFRSWSDHGALAHTYHAGAGVDTVRATFAAEYRVLVQLVNALPGAVTLAAAPPGADLAAGVYLPSGLPMTLIASAPTGTVFGGWSGDTTSGNATLTLPMGHPYSVTARFVADVAVSIDAAANTLLGTASLSADQITYLDARGNHDGVYDLGDFLAFAKASGITPTVGVIQELMAQRVRRSTPGKGK